MSEAKNESGILTREKILLVDEKPSIRVLPSGIPVEIAYISLNFVIETFEKFPTDDGQDRLFAEHVIAWMLRKNEQKDLNWFTEDDQRNLIEIAADKWGCKDQYDSLATIQTPEQRFYLAVREQEKAFAVSLSTSLNGLSRSVASSFSQLSLWQGELASTLKALAGVDNMFCQMRDTLSAVNLRFINQARQVAALSGPIVNLAQIIAGIDNSVRLPYERLLLGGVGETLQQYQGLMQSLISNDNFFSTYDVVNYYPTLKMRNTAVVVGQLVGEKIPATQEVTVIVPDPEELANWLENIKPNLPNMLVGAKQSIFSQNPDRTRHFAVSQREIFTQLLHTLAPDDEVKKWTRDPHHFKDGQPTRRARLLYLARNYQNPPFVDFAIQIFTKQMDLLNADTHCEEHEYSEDELLLLHDHFLSTLGFLMKIVG